MPTFLLWGVGMPWALYRAIKRNERNLDDLIVYAKYAFVYEGLKLEKFYWEFITMIRKILVIFVSVFVNNISYQAQAFVTFLILIGFSLIHQRSKPYEVSSLNKLEMTAMISLCIMAYTAMFFLSGGSDPSIELILIVVCVVVNIFFFVMVGINLVKAYKKTISEMKTAIQKKYVKAKQKKSSVAYVEKLCMDSMDSDLMLDKYNFEYKPKNSTPQPVTYLKASTVMGLGKLPDDDAPDSQRAFSYRASGNLLNLGTEKS